MADIDLGMLPERWIQDIGDVGPRGQKDRIPITIDKAIEIPASHPIDKLKASHVASKFEKYARDAIVFLRRYEIQKIVLDDLEKNSEAYGDFVDPKCELTSEEVQAKVDEMNFKGTAGDSPYETEETIDEEQRESELSYIGRFIFKANLFYGKKDKRNEKLISINSDIDYHKEILHNHIFHNYNMGAILSGKIKKEDGYKGILPDPQDYKYVQNYRNELAKQKKDDNTPYITNIKIEKLVKTSAFNLKKENAPIKEKSNTVPIQPVENKEEVKKEQTTQQTSEVKEEKVEKKPLKVRVTKVKRSDNKDREVEILEMLNNDVKNKYTSSGKIR